MTRSFMLTTMDNPFSPFTDYENWYNYDVEMGHNTCAYLARIAITSPELSEDEEREAIEKAMNEIVKLNITGNYLKVDNSFVPKPLEVRGL